MISIIQLFIKRFSDISQLLYWPKIIWEIAIMCPYSESLGVYLFPGFSYNCPGRSADWLTSSTDRSLRVAKARPQVWPPPIWFLWIGRTSIFYYLRHSKIKMTTLTSRKEVEIVYRLFLVNCYLLHVPRLPSRTASNVWGSVVYWKVLTTQSND